MLPEGHIFVSDIHLGAGDAGDAQRRRLFVDFLDSLESPAVKALYLLGDIFDFWFEFADGGIPSGFDDVLDALSSVRGRGVETFFFKGNHDQWTFGYLEKRTGMRVLQQPYLIRIGSLTLCLGHGHALGRRRAGERLLGAIFTSRLCIKAFSLLPTAFATRIALRWSSSHKKKYDGPYLFDVRTNPLMLYLDDFGARCAERVDHYIFGHYHCGGSFAVPSGGTLHILQGWISPFSSPSPCGNFLSLEEASGTLRELSLQEDSFRK